jgi:hypothetical protein
MMRRVITVPIDVSTISQTAFLRPTGAEPSLHRPPAGWLPSALAGTDSGGVMAGMFQHVLECGSLCIPDGAQFDLRLKSAIWACNFHE